MAPTNKHKKLLKQLSDALTMSDVGSMKFVCRDKLGAGLLEKVNNEKPYELFTVLEQNGLISADDLSCLRDILVRIQRSDLAAQIPVKQQMLESVDGGAYPGPMSPGISPYRSFLKDLADELTSSQVDEIKFLLNIPGGKSASITDGENLLLYMESDGQLSETKFGILKDVLKDVHRVDLIKKIDKFALNGESAQVFNSPHQVSSPSPTLMRPAEFTVPAGALPGESPPHYAMKEPPFGYALIINNETFDGRTREGLKLNKRDGTHVDLDNLKNLWKKLGFVVEAHSNLKAHKIASVAQDMVEKINEHDVQPSCFACCIMSHGKYGDIYGSDSKTVAVNVITGYFKEENCHALAGKPKLFFIQACRGQNKLKTTTTTTPASRQESHMNPDATPGGIDQDESFRQSADLNESHFLLGYSTLSGFVSWRSTQYGSWYVGALVEIFRKHFEQEDVMTMMVRVNEKVTDAYTREGYKQCPAPVVTLTKRVYFKPPTTVQ